jgi:hypothetical protein
MGMSPLEWYYARGKKQFGPVPSTELKMLADAGDLRAEELVWHDGMEQWVAAGKVRGLFEESAGRSRLSETISDPIAPPEALEPLALPTYSTAPSATAPSPTAISSPSDAIGAISPARVPPATRPAGEAFERSSAAYERARESDAGHLFDVLLEAARQRLGGHFVDAAVELFATIGHWGLYVAMGFTLMVQLALALESRSAGLAIFGLAAAFVLAILQYAARRFAGGLDRLLRSSAGRMSSTVLLDCFALLHAIAGLTVLLGLSVWALQTGDYWWIGPAIGAFIVMEYSAVVALNPETLNLVITSDAAATEEALGVMTFLFKLMVKVAPIIFGVGTAWGVSQLAYAAFLMIQPTDAAATIGPSTGFPFAALLPSDLKSQVPQSMVWSGVKTLAVSASLPIAAYVAFLVFHVGASVLVVLLGLPAQLNALKSGAEKEG